MKRPVIVGANPFIHEYYRRDTKALLAETGGNTGNLAFEYAVTSHLAGCPVVPWSTPAEKVRELGDVVVLPLANQLGPHTDLSDQAKKLETFDLPVIGVGLGAQAESKNQDVQLTPGTTRWLATIIDHAPSQRPNIGVRGEYTLSQIEKRDFKGAAVIIGCPSNFINLYDDVSSSIEKRLSSAPREIAVAAGIPYVPHLSGIEAALADIVELAGGTYIVQHNLEMIYIARNGFAELSDTTALRFRDYIRPHLSIDEFESWCRRFAVAFFDVRAWMEHLGRYDFVVGTRFHGLMLAVQVGVPVGCISHDSRLHELCETMALPVRHYSEIAGGLNRHKLTEMFPFSKAHFDKTRLTLAGRYREIFRDADVPLSGAFERWLARSVSN